MAFKTSFNFFPFFEHMANLLTLTIGISWKNFSWILIYNKKNLWVWESATSNLKGTAKLDRLRYAGNVDFWKTTSILKN